MFQDDPIRELGIPVVDSESADDDASLEREESSTGVAMETGGWSLQELESGAIGLCADGRRRDDDDDFDDDEDFAFDDDDEELDEEDDDFYDDDYDDDDDDDFEDLDDEDE